MLRPVTLSIGDVVTTSEVLEFITEKSGTEYALNYSLGRQGSSSAGGFQIISAKGRDGTTLGGLEGDRWKVNFLALPRVGITANAGTDNVTLTVISADDGGYELSASHVASSETFCLSSADGAIVLC